MAKKYVVRYNRHSIEMTKPNSTILVYRIPYKDVESKKIGFQIPNPFIVYILIGKNNHGKDMIYVGKSKNGISNRPTSHKDKYEEWTMCYVLTQFRERTFFNDGTIQYLEDQLNHRIDEIDLYNNTTKTTNAGTANKDDEEDCDEYLEEAFKMLDILGLDLVTNSEAAIAEEDVDDTSLSEVENRKKIPNGIYTMNRKLKRLNDQSFSATMEVKDGKFILKAGSQIAPGSGSGLNASIEEVRNNTPLEDGILKSDIEMNSPSACGIFVIGGPCNGWTNWKNADGKSIDIYRQ